MLSCLTYGQIHNYFIAVFIFLSFFLNAAGQVDESILEAKMLMSRKGQEENDYIMRNLQAASILEDHLQKHLLSPFISEKKIVELRLLLAQAYLNARDYSQALVVLSSIVTNHSDQFYEVERLIRIIRNVRADYNGLLGGFLAEASKDPNDPEDPFNEAIALSYINQMEDLYPENPSIVEQINQYKVQVKLVVDHGYYDQIIQRAHELIIAGDYLAAMESYIDIGNIDSSDLYEDSFELQEEEFLALGLPELFIDQVQSLTEKVKALNIEFAVRDSALEATVAYYNDIFSDIFPADPMTISNSLFSEDSRITSNPLSLLDGLFAELAAFVNLRTEIEVIAQQIISLRESAPGFLPASEASNSLAHLLYLEHFISGSPQFDLEGIVGAAIRQSRYNADQLKYVVLDTLNNYATFFDQAYELDDYERLPTLFEPFREASDFLFLLLSFISQGQSLDFENFFEYVEQIQGEDRVDAILIFLEGKRIAGRIAMSNFHLRFGELSNREYVNSGDFLAAFRQGLEFLKEVETYTDELKVLFNNLDEEFSNYDLSFNAILLQHNSDRTRLVSEIQKLLIDHYNQYIAFEQDAIPGLYEQALTDINDGNIKLAGVEVSTILEGIATVSAQYYPEEAVVSLLAARDNLTVVIDESERILDLINEAPDFVKNSSKIQAISNMSGRVIENANNIFEEINNSITMAFARIDEASSLISEARSLQNSFAQAQNQQDYETAETIFARIDDAYSDSLRINYTAELFAERESVFSRLSQELSTLLIEVITIEKARALERLAIALDAQDYFTARDALKDAQTWDEKLPTPNDPIIAAFIIEVERSIVLSSQRDVPPVSDSRYSRITNDLNEAGKQLISAINAAENNNTVFLKQGIEKARSFVNSIKDQLPSNFEAAFIELQLIQLEDPENFDNYFEEQITDIEKQIYGGSDGTFASGDYGTYNLSERDELLARIEALTALRQSSRLEQMIIDVEVDLGRRESPKIIAIRNQANELIDQSESLITKAKQESDPALYESLIAQALAYLKQAQSIYPLIPRLSSLISEAEVLLGLEVTVTLPYEANQLFEQAASLFASQDLVGAKRLLDILWSNTSYRSYFPLKDLIFELYTLLGQEAPRI